MRRVSRLFGCPFSRAGRTWRVGLLLSVLIAQHVCHAEQPWPLRQHYRARLLDTSGRIVDHTDGDRSTSEGQADVLLPLRMQANGRVLQVLGPTFFSAAAIRT